MTLPAYRLVELVSEHAQEATGHSWQRLNTALDTAMTLANLKEAR